MSQALKRHERGESRVIPVLLRPVYWGKTPFAKLQPLPKNKKPIMGTGWLSQDEALFDVAEGIRKVAEELSAKRRKEREAEHGRRKSLYTADVCIFLQCNFASSDIECYSDPRWFST